MRDEEFWTVSVSDSTFITTLDRRGWVGEWDSGKLYKNYKIPAKAITVRSRKVVEAPHQGRSIEGLLRHRRAARESENEKRR
jgi:hypothetical protein